LNREQGYEQDLNKPSAIASRLLTPNTADIQNTQITDFKILNLQLHNWLIFNIW